MANEMRDRHLVTDNPQNMTESMLNFAYAKDKKVYLRYANGIEDIDLCEYISQLTKGGCELSADDVMQGSCIEGCDCEKAVIYALAVQAAELRERLKHYESLEEQGLLPTLPCKIDDKVYVISRYYAGDWEVYKCEIEAITIYEKNTFISCVANDVRFGKINFGLNISEIGKTVFLTKDQAEQKLKEMRGE